MKIRRFVASIVLVLLPSVAGAVEGLVGGVGDDRTLQLLYALDRFEIPDPGVLTRQLWFDPYLGDDAANDGSPAAPYRSIAKMKEVCVSHVRCTISGQGRVFSPLTLRMTGIGPGEDYQRGERVDWDGGASSGTVLDWSAPHRILVIDWDAGTRPIDGESGLTGSVSGAVGSIASDQGIVNTVGGHVVYTFAPSAIDPASGSFSIAGHSYVDREGPMRLSSSGLLPTGLTASTDYYICASTPSTFRIDDDPTCSSPFSGFASAGTGTHGIAGASNWIVDEPFVPSCEDPDRICILIESQFPSSPAVIDGNRYHATGFDNRTVPGVFGPNPDNGLAYVAGYGNGWVGWQNIRIQNIATDAFSNQSASVGKLVALNSTARDIRNGSENRTSSIATNNCYTSHGAGALIGINAGGSESRVDDPLDHGTGACLAPTGTGKFAMIGTGTFRSERVGPTSSATLASTGSDIVVIGHELLGATTGNTVAALGANDGQARLHLARVVLRSSAVGNGAALAMLGGQNRTTVRVYETTMAGSAGPFAGALWIGHLSPAGLELTARGLLIDDFPYWLQTANRTSSIQFANPVHLEGYFDDQDTAGGDAFEFMFQPFVASTTVAQAQSLVRQLGGAGWSLFQTRSHDSNGTAPGTAWLSDSAGLRCQPTQACWAAFRDWYTIPLETTLEPDPDRSCLPADVLGERLCSFRLRGTHVGARGAPDADGDLVADETEISLGTDPADSDSDDDGLDDGFEIAFGFPPLVGGDGIADSDGDALDNVEEQTHGTNPRVADTDRDGVFDGVEVGVGTSPVDADSDDDGLGDSFEIANGFDPLVAGDADRDPDADDLTNAEEEDQGTDPRDPDTDDDGYSDSWEVEFRSDPLDPESMPIPVVPASGGIGLCLMLTAMIRVAIRASRGESA